MSKAKPDYLILTPSSVPSKTSGGTAHILPEERKNASFDVQELTHILNGGKEMTKRRTFIENALKDDPELANQIHNFSRQESMTHHLKNFINIHKPFKNFKPIREDILFMSEVGVSTGALSNSHSIFVSTIVGQGNDEQQQFWVPKLFNFEITGSYAQTELGHGSNVRGLETTATYDHSTEEFVLNTPTLTSMKFWPGCLGKVATHVVLYAQLIINGKEHGVNVFIVQIRDENHKPLEGIKLGDLGNKIGDHSNDTGFMILENVRIPRTFMLSKYRTVTKEGEYVEVLKADPKVHYFTMAATRANMTGTAGVRLCQAATIAIRYSTVRQQGFTDSKGNVSYKTKEHKIIDHKIQQYRLLKQLATGYALKFTGLWMVKQLSKLEGKNYGVISNSAILKELAATSAGLKSLCTIIATNGIEDLRKCCGGNGYLLNSGIASLACDYLWQVTAEGDFVILALLTARHLLTSVGKVYGGAKLTGVIEYLNVVGEKGFNLMNIRPRNAKSTSEYLDINYLQSWFRYRAIERNATVAKEFSLLMKKKNLSFEDAWNECTNDLLKATQSHCYFIIIQNFAQVLSEITDSKIKKVLSRLFCLFALANLQDENWGDTIDSDQFRLIKLAINGLLSDIRPDAIPLVDAFDYKDKYLRSTIGRYDGNVYEALFDAAQKSILNQTDPFDGYEEYLKPHLNKELLKRGNKPILNSPKL